MILTSLRPYDLSVANARQPVVASTVLAVLATIMTLLRYANRLVQKAAFGWDDFLILGALVRFIINTSPLGLRLNKRIALFICRVDSLLVLCHAGWNGPTRSRRWLSGHSFDPQGSWTVHVC
jgi:hypothetical protein